MIVELLFKDYKRLHRSESKFKGTTFFKVLFGFFGLCLFVALIVYLSMSVDRKIAAYSESAPFDLMVFFLALLGIFTTIDGALKARKLLFDEQDNKIILPLPILTYHQILAKMIYVYIYEVIENFVVALPMLCVYMAYRDYPAFYYFAAFCYPFAMGLFFTGIAFLLSLVFEFVYKLIKDKDFIQFGLACLLMILLCYGYYYFLNLFMVSLQDGSINGVISESFVSGLKSVLLLFTPLYNFVLLSIGNNAILPNLCIYFGMTALSLFIGYTSSYYAFLSASSSSEVYKEVKEEKIPVVRYGFINLLKKEMDLLFKNSSNIFSYTSLLILLPFLSYAVISSFNAIFARNFSVVITYYPEFFALINLALILLFVGCINASSSLSMSNEKQGLLVTKLLPCSLREMLLAKLLAPSLLSFISFFISATVLFGFGEISLNVYLAALALGFLLILLQNVLGLLLDMRDKDSNHTFKLGFLTTVISFLLPIAVFGIGCALTMNGISSFYVYLTLVLMTLGATLLSLIRIGSRMEKAFYHMEVRS